MAQSTPPEDLMHYHAMAQDALRGVVKAALTAENAFQCGYCAPGFLVTLTALFTRTPAADETQIRRALEGNICRCTGYHSIMRGALRAGEMLAGSAGETA